MQLSLETTFLKSGKGIITGGFTTAFTFITLCISSSRGMKEMGLVTGFGLLAIMLATFLVLPVLLIRREKRVDKKFQKSGKTVVKRGMTFHFLGNIQLAWPALLVHHRRLHRGIPRSIRYLQGSRIRCRR
ncbi:MAG: MMPL family transporter [Acidobacteria bacterium]|nr:MMPL family transporter [Acidobacteriota bacterium]